MSGPDGCAHAALADARVDEARHLVTFHAQLPSREGLCPSVISYAHLHLGIDFSTPYDIPVHVALSLRAD